MKTLMQISIDTSKKTFFEIKKEIELQTNVICKITDYYNFTDEQGIDIWLLHIEFDDEEDYNYFKLLYNHYIISAVNIHELFRTIVSRYSQNLE